MFPKILPGCGASKFGHLDLVRYDLVLSKMKSMDKHILYLARSMKTRALLKAFGNLSTTSLYHFCLMTDLGLFLSITSTFKTCRRPPGDPGDGRGMVGER